MFFLVFVSNNFEVGSKYELTASPIRG